MWSGQEYEMPTENRFLALNKEEMKREAKRKTQDKVRVINVKYSNYLLQMINLILFLRNNNLHV